eukprot:Selendium_serpulae@DN4232_c0_g1_i3.p1
MKRIAVLSLLAVAVVARRRVEALPLRRSLATWQTSQPTWQTSEPTSQSSVLDRGVSGAESHWLGPSKHVGPAATYGSQPGQGRRGKANPFPGMFVIRALQNECEHR